MNPDNKITGTPDAWENGDLGRDEGSVRRSSPEREKELQEALDLQPISIRLQRTLIEDLKLIARHHGMGYQPMIRELLGRFVTGEMRQIAYELEKKKEAERLIREEEARREEASQKRRVVG